MNLYNPCAIHQARYAVSKILNSPNILNFRKEEIQKYKTFLGYKRPTFINTTVGEAVITDVIGQYLRYKMGEQYYDCGPFVRSQEQEEWHQQGLYDVDLDITIGWKPIVMTCPTQVKHLFGNMSGISRAAQKRYQESAKQISRAGYTFRGMDRALAYHTEEKGVLINSSAEAIVGQVFSGVFSGENHRINRYSKKEASVIPNVYLLAWTHPKSHASFDAFDFVFLHMYYQPDPFDSRMAYLTLEGYGGFLCSILSVGNIGFKQIALASTL